MEFIYFKLKETFRYKTRDKVFANLCRIGVDAHLIEGRHLQREDSESLGLIEIQDSPIRCVNVIHEKRCWGENLWRSFL